MISHETVDLGQTLTAEYSGLRETVNSSARTPTQRTREHIAQQFEEKSISYD